MITLTAGVFKEGTVINVRFEVNLVRVILHF